MDGNGKLDELIRMVQEMRDEVKALREELERNRADMRTIRQQAAPFNRTGWVVHRPNPGEPRQKYCYCQDEPPTHAHGIYRSSGYTIEPQLSDDETID